MKSDQSSAMANFFSQAGKAVGEVIDGGARQTTQIAQAQQQVAQNSANNASSAREDAARNYNEMLSGLQALFSYAQALTR